MSMVMAVFCCQAHIDWWDVKKEFFSSSGFQFLKRNQTVIPNEKATREENARNKRSFTSHQAICLYIYFHLLSKFCYKPKFDANFKKNCDIQTHFFVHSNLLIVYANIVHEQWAPKTLNLTWALTKKHTNFHFRQ